MTDGGKMARRSARVFAEEYQPSLEMTPNEINRSVIREQEEVSTENKSRSRDSSRSSISLMNFGMDVCAGIGSSELAGQAMECLDIAKALDEEFDTRPVNFGTVAPGFYRSGYPQAENYKYLKSLGLKTIVTLVQKDFPEGYQTFMESNGIKHIVVDIQGTKKVKIPTAIMKSVVEIALDQWNYPILMHCNHGKHRTGCVVGVIRKVMGWRPEPIVEEYARYAHPKTRESDISYIEGFDVNRLSDVEVPRPDDASRALSIAVSRARMFRILVFAAAVLGLWTFTTLQLDMNIR